MTVTTRKLKLKFGRRHPLPGGAKVPRFADYLRGDVQPPLVVNYNNNAATENALRRMYLNDRLGTCVEAAVAKMVGVFTGNQPGGAARVYSDAEIVALYRAMAGYDGTPATDKGTFYAAALNWWQAAPQLPGVSKIVGYLRLDPRDMVQMRQALHLLEGVLLGFDCPDAWRVAADNFLWASGVPNPANGHAVPLFGYDSTGFLTASWARLGRIQNEGIVATAEEAFAVVSPDAGRRLAARNRKAARGFDFDKMFADLARAGAAILKAG